MEWSSTAATDKESVRGNRRNNSNKGTEKERRVVPSTASGESRIISFLSILFRYKKIKKKIQKEKENYFS
uniref:Uncharacterized protein n=1 Tax=Rhizophora mucronata TaxID=61149 RepID=A0A2P2R0W4_RHIMU